MHFFQTFINKTLGNEAGIVISIAVAIACIGTINSSMLGDTRYSYDFNYHSYLLNGCAIVMENIDGFHILRECVKFL